MNISGQLLFSISSIFRKFRLNLEKFKYCGENVFISSRYRFFHSNMISIGNNVYIGPDSWINGVGGVTIGSGTIIGPKLSIYSANHNYRDASALPYDNIVFLDRVSVGENVWIGGNVILLPGASLGEGCIVGAGAVVTKKYPPFSVLGGNPAKLLGKRDEKHYKQLKMDGQIYLKLKVEGKMKEMLINRHE